MDKHSMGGGTQDHKLVMGSLGYFLVLCEVPRFLGVFTLVSLPMATFLHDGMISASHQFYFSKPP